MKNHYKVLQVPRSANNKDIKNKTKELLSQIKNSKISDSEKNKLSMKVYESYKFLNDYHSRKSLETFQYRSTPSTSLTSSNPISPAMYNCLRYSMSSDASKDTKS